MNERSRAGWTATGIVEAPVEQVWQALLEFSPYLSAADRRAITSTSGPQVFSASRGQPEAGRVHIEADKKQHRLVVKGEWWYCGVHSVEPHPRGSLLAYRIYNVAPGLGWWLAQLMQGPQAASKIRGELQTLLTTIGQRLGCKVAILARLSTNRIERM